MSDEPTKLTDDDIISGAEVDRRIIGGIRTIIKEELEAAVVGRTAIFLVPVIIKKKYDILEVKIERSGCDVMICNGCGKDMGPLNPKGFFRTSEGWFKLCHQCCIDQGFLTK